MTELLKRWRSGNRNALEELILFHSCRASYTTSRIGAFAIPLDDRMMAVAMKPEELIALNAALEQLATVDPRKAQVVELRYFGGLNVEETAAVVGVHPNSVIRDWRLAKVWLKRELIGRASAH